MRMLIESIRGQQFFALILTLLFAATATGNVVINEIMYNSAGSPDIEWVELYNTGEETVDLTDWWLIDSDLAHTHCLLAGELEAGGYLVVAADPVVFVSQYPSVSNINVYGFDLGGTGFGLGNSGDTVSLHNNFSVVQDFVVYDDGGAWPGSADGDGPSLELLTPLADNNLATSWDPSHADWGTPGAQNSVFVDNQAPIIHDTDRYPKLPRRADIVEITAEVTDTDGLEKVELLVDLGSGFVAELMYDDGLHNDGAAADGEYGTTIPARGTGTLVKYYVKATDLVGQITTKPSAAPASYRAYTVGHVVPALVINEIMADNVQTIADNAGEFDDWVEIYNNSNTTVNLGGMYLTDSFSDHRMWELPDVDLSGHGRLVFWCDNDLEQGDYHTNFKLSTSGEDIALYDNEEGGNTLISGFEFGLQNPDVSFGFTDYWPYPVFDKDYVGVNLSIVDHPEYMYQPSPGLHETDVNIEGVVISEFHTTSAAGGVDDWIELRNFGGESVDITGWGITDDKTEPMKYVFPLDSSIGARQFLVIDETEMGFSLSSAGEIIMLTKADGETAVGFISFPEQQPDVSYARFEIAYCSYWYYCLEPTPGGYNGYNSPVDEDLIPEALQITSVAPNPFNPTTNIFFNLPKDGEVILNIYSLSGRLVRTINSGSMSAGKQTVRFDGNDDQGRRLPSGIWFARISSDNHLATVKMTLVK